MGGPTSSPTKVQRPGAPEWEWLVRQPSGVHIAVTILNGTATHLREVHDIEPDLGGTKEARVSNIRAHLAAHKA